MATFHRDFAWGDPVVPASDYPSVKIQPEGVSGLNETKIPRFPAFFCSIRSLIVFLLPFTHTAWAHYCSPTYTKRLDFFCIYWRKCIYYTETHK